MKILPFALSVAAVACVSSSLYAQGSSVNVFPNGAMEMWGANYEAPKSGAPGVTVPNGYMLDDAEFGTEAGPGEASGATIAQDGLIKHGGEYSVRIENAEPFDITNVAFKQVPVEPNTRYKVKVWVRGEDIDKGKEVGPCVWVHFGPADNFWASPNAKRIMHRVPTDDPTFDWMPVEFEVDTLPDTAFMRASVQMRKAVGKVWFDDLEVTPMGPAQATQ